MAKASHGSSEGIVAASAIHIVSTNIPAALENSKMHAKPQTDEEGEIVEICPPEEEKDAEEHQLVPSTIPNLAFRSASAAASVVTYVPAGIPGAIPGAIPEGVLNSRSRLAGSMPARRGSAPASRVSKALRSRGFAVPRRGSRVAHNRRKVFGPPERIRCRGFGIVPLRGVGGWAKSPDSSSLVPNTAFTRFVQNLLNEHPPESRMQASVLAEIEEAVEALKMASVGSSPTQRGR